MKNNGNPHFLFAHATSIMNLFHHAKFQERKKSSEAPERVECSPAESQVFNKILSG